VYFNDFIVVFGLVDLGWLLVEKQEPCQALGIGVEGFEL
jgi:hypothetical protein